MKKVSSAILMLFSLSLLLCSCTSNESDPKSMQKEIVSILSGIEKDYSIHLSFTDIPQTSWKIDYKLADESEYAALLQYVRSFEQEFRKYPKNFITKTKLETVVFLEDLSINGQLRTAIPDYFKHLLLYDFKRGAFDQDYVRHCMHHEFYHLIEYEIHGNAYWKDPDWARLNDGSSSYGLGGASVQNNSNVFAFTHPAKGFINLYSLSALEEDKAEIYACLFIKPEFEGISKWFAEDSVLLSKVNAMKDFLKSLDGSMDEQYWMKIEN